MTLRLSGSRAVVILGLAGSFITSSIQAAENRDTKVRNDKSSVESGGQWIYNQFDQALAEARRSNKPVLVTLRCIP